MKFLVSAALSCFGSLLLSSPLQAQERPAVSKKAVPSKAAAPKVVPVDISAPTEFPQRKAGLWEIRTTAAQASGLPPAMYCVGEHTDTVKEHLDRTYGEKGSCRVSAFRKIGSAWVSESVCREGKNIVSSRSIVSGDLTVDYRIDTETSYVLAQGNKRDDKEALAARYINPCPANLRPGDLLIAGMGKINMVDGQVLVPRPASRKKKPR